MNQKTLEKQKDKLAYKYRSNSLNYGTNIWVNTNSFMSGFDASTEIHEAEIEQLKLQIEEMNKNCISLSLHDSRIQALEAEIEKVQTKSTARFYIQENNKLRSALEKAAEIFTKIEDNEKAPCPILGRKTLNAYCASCLANEAIADIKKVLV